MCKGRRGPLVAGAGVVALAVLLMLLPGPAEDEPGLEAPATTSRPREAEQTHARSRSSPPSSRPRLDAPEARRRSRRSSDADPADGRPAGCLLLLKNAAVQSSGSDGLRSRVGTPALDATTGLSIDPVAITASGTYFALAEFLYSIETLPRAAKVLERRARARAEADHRPPRRPRPAQLQMRASVVLYTSDQRGPGSEPGPTSADALRCEGGLTMPLTERDRRTLMIGGGIARRAARRVLPGHQPARAGGDDGARSRRCPRSRHGARRDRRCRRPTADGLALDGVRPRPVFTGRDPFSIPPVFRRRLRPRPRRGTRQRVAAAERQHQHAATAGGTTTTTTTGPAPTTPGGNSSTSIGGKTVVLLDTFTAGRRHGPGRGRRHGVSTSARVTRSAAARSSCGRSPATAPRSCSATSRSRSAPTPPK